MSDVLAQVLVRRGLGDPAAARAFLHPDFRVHDPYLMTGMSDARRRLDQALRRGEAIAVHGDYDADGITATFLLVSVLAELGADVRWRLPNRFSEGYGVSAAAVDELAEAGVKLLITVDCGINAREEVAQAQALGMDVIVTDHHELEGDLPACTVVTPKLGAYPCRHLAGVGVAFKLAHALLEEPGDELADLPLALRPYTDLVAVGTIADVVPLIEENRVLTAIGLGRLRSAPRPGLATLLEVAGGRPGAVDAGAVGFRLGPRLNAAGRLEDASIALELLGAADRDAALPLALRLNELNRERQTIEAAMLEAAVAMVPDPPPRRARALVARLARGRRGHRRVARRRALPPSGDPAQRGRRGGQGLGTEHRGVRPARRRGAHRGPSAHVRRASRRLRPAPAARRHPGVPRGVRRRGRVRARPRRPAAGARRRRHRRRRRAHARPGRRARAARASRLRQPAGDAAAPRGGGGGAAPHAGQAARPVPRALRRQLLPGHPLQLRRPRRAHGAGTPRRRALAQQERLQRLGERPGAGAQPAPARASADGPVRHRVRPRCRDRLRGDRLWQALLGAGDGARAAADDDGAGDAAAAAALHAARAAGRIVDRRGRPPVSQLAALLAGGERVLVLVADVARRRPLLTRDVLAPGPAPAGAPTCRPPARTGSRPPRPPAWS